MSSRRKGGEEVPGKVPGKLHEEVREKGGGKRGKRVFPFRKRDLDFSWWTPWRSVKASVAVAALGMAAGGLIYHCDSRAHEDIYDAAHSEHVRSEFAAYDSYRKAVRPADTCLTPGSDIKVVRDSIVVMGVQSVRREWVIGRRLKFDNSTDSNDSRPFIRPVDGGQDVLITSDVYLRGLEYCDVEGLWRNSRTGIEMVPDVPDIFLSYFEIVGVEVGSRNIPLRHVEARLPDDGHLKPYYYLDMLKLVEEGVLEEEDFEGGLEMRVYSSVGIPELPDSIGDFEHEVAGMFAYKRLPGHLRKYTRSLDAYPTQHGRIREMVDGYTGAGFDVLDIVKYAVDQTGKALEYESPKGDEDVLSILESGKGVCRNYASLFITLMRAFGVPARYARGLTADGSGSKFRGSHAWAEVLLPFRDGTFRWIPVEPTWADNSYDPDEYINHVDSQYLYHIDFDVKLDTSDHGATYHLFQEHGFGSSRILDLDAPVSGDGSVGDRGGDVRGGDYCSGAIRSSDGGTSDCCVSDPPLERIVGGVCEGGPGSAGEGCE